MKHLLTFLLGVAAGRELLKLETKIKNNSVPMNPYKNNKLDSLSFSKVEPMNNHNDLKINTVSMTDFPNDSVLDSIKYGLENGL